MLGTHFYNESIKKTIIGFGTLFNNIELRKIDNSGTTIQTIKVPLAYGPREKFLARIESEPSLNNRKPVQIQLPRISFELQDIKYDSTRKLGPVQVCRTKSENPDSVISHYMPVPYNLTFQLSIISKNNDDAVQILEQILPYFQPHFSITITMLANTDEKKDIPIILQDVNIQDDYEGDFQSRRSLVYNLTFTVKSYIYGPVVTSDVIKTVNIDIGDNINSPRSLRYTVTPKALEDYNEDGEIDSLDDPFVEPDDNFGFNEMWTEIVSQ